MSKDRNTRRRILLGVTGGVAGISQLPSGWTKPVIKSIVLPAHAQTSSTTTAGPTTTGGPTTTAGPTTTTTTTTPCPINSFTIPGGTAVCGTGDRNRFFRYTFAPGCPRRVSGGGGDVVAQLLVNSTRALIKVTVGGTLIRGNLTCNQPRASSRSGSPTFTASDGSRWRAVVNITADGIDTVTLDDIVVTRL